MFQTGIIKLCRRDSSIKSNGIDVKEIEKIIDEKIKNLNVNISNSNKVVNSPNNNLNMTNNRKEEQQNDQTQKNNSSTDMVWKKIVDNLKRNGKIRLYTALINTRINELNDLVWEIEFSNGLTAFNERVLEMPENKNELVKEALKITGKEINFKLKKGKGDGVLDKPKSPISDLGIDINIID